MLGLPRGSVVLTTHQCSWKQLYLQEAQHIQMALGDAALQVEHIGSTAIPGILAKPIIDLMVGIASLSTADTLLTHLERIGYEHRTQDTVSGRLMLAKGPPHQRTYYLSLAEVESRFWREKLLFRDYLRRHPETAKAYEHLKQELAQQYHDDRSSYTAGKSTFVAQILQSAQANLD